MSRHTIYIKEEDEAKWQAIKSKPEWLHEHLNTPGIAQAVALEDISKGQSGSVYLTTPDPSYEPMEPTA